MSVLRITSACLSIAFFVSCSARQVEKKELQSAGYDSIAAQRYGQGVEFIQNVSGTAMLCVKNSKPTQLNPQSQLAFFVFDVKTKKVLFEDSMPNGGVSWRDDSTIVVSIIPGTIRDDDRTPAPRPGYIFDIRLKKTRNLENMNLR